MTDNIELDPRVQGAMDTARRVFNDHTKAADMHPGLNIDPLGAAMQSLVQELKLAGVVDEGADRPHEDIDTVAQRLAEASGQPALAADRWRALLTKPSIVHFAFSYATKPGRGLPPDTVSSLTRDRDTLLAYIRDQNTPTP